MTDFIPLDQTTFSYLIEGNIALSGFTLLKLFHLDKKFCTRLTKVVTALKIKFPDIAKVLD